ncbi:nitroreductase family protein [Paenibacillus mucilaginosus]|uniref:NAD(P)H nitroreductase n=2 Tax=Paenibacillus mucilaginosus TaxID=61624 RepID=I0BJF9_9BACL|nr:nitroreductase family protein [Paenibacillus mucilaginosus]AEI41723.1 YdgI [Paenibacillus mucilaginosus KNP414]AFH62506.1 NAD(P)H nitroreductase [Paenibacillus mucilaginosus K02]MCG7214415.1 nitroreductase family protein [Paenibacillus mucilaginosus]WDM30700.1 nitroreductase family protein [Paenibacillus mucilaginosus]
MSEFQKTNDFKEITYGRRSVKAYDPEVKISREEMTDILEGATRAPSSVNAQPWRFVVIESQEGKEKLAPLARFNQTQVLTSSAVIAVFADMNNAEYLDEIYGKMVELGYMPQDVKEMQLKAIKNYYGQLPAADLRDVNFIDAGLVSMQLMLVARAHGYDTNPIGGYEKDKIAEAFGLDQERYQPIMLISIGKAAKEGYPSYRLPVETVTTWN